jgi:4-hydroxy-4-methyl-2-oxoglutarate aldolase
MNKNMIATPEELNELLKFDTPSITNVVATYPLNSDSCLGLYHPWKGRWYTDQSLKCIYPELGRRVGYAVTCVYGVSDPNYKRLALADVLRAIDKAPKPVVLIVKQNFPDEIKNINGLLGGNMMTAFKSVGVVGVISDGPSRDVDEIRPLGLQYMLTGVTAGHGDFSVHAINVPVSVCGMDVAPGEIIHMDENGAVKFPAEYLDEVTERATKLQQLESKRQGLMRETNDVEEVIKIMKGMYD